MKCFMFVDEHREKKGVRAASDRLRQECVYQYQSQQAQLCQVKPEFGNAKLMNIYEAAVQFVDGSSIMEHSKRKSVAMAC
ncbi:hypothetical protein C2S51_038392 [Perilla frutescens var. frutescens]|nr:hypothetical protein C2S51_038392 [Perilla frutescens var. frutescens]